MVLFRIGNTRIECGFMTPVLLAFMLIFGMVPAVILSFAALTLHDAAHSCVAKRLGADVYAIEIQPFGFVARMNGVSIADELAVALAGPLFSLVCGISALCVCAYLYSSAYLKLFASINLALGLINLLPALPLDGGRVFRVLLAKMFSPRAGVVIGACAGIVAAALMCAFGVYLLVSGKFNVTPVIMGIFLSAGAIKEFKSADGARVSAIARRNIALRQGNAVRVNKLAVHKNVRAGSALRMLRSDCFNVITIVDDDMSPLGEISEHALVVYIARNGADSPVFCALS